MSSTMKMSLLALVSTVAAVPHYGAHSKFHTLKPSAGEGYGNHGTGTGRPYPTAGWPGHYNSTAIPYPTGTGSYEEGKTTTLDVTSTSTETIYSTVYVKPSSAEATGVAAEDVPTGNGQCGPATVTVTASEKVTVTITPGYDAPSSVYTPAPEQPETYVVVSPTPKAEYPAEYPAETPKVETPKAEESTSSKVQEYVAPTPKVTSSVAETPVYSSAAPSYTAPSTGYTGIKRGLAYNDASLCKTFGSKFGYAYNWGQVENNDIGTHFIPMMHGPSKSTAEEWLANVDKAVKKGSTAVMGFNECDHAEQCNLSPEAACSAWKEYLNPVKSKYPEVTIIGPSVTNGAAPMGLDWLSRFHTACPDAVVDATNIHFYDIYEAETINRFKAQVEKAAELYGKKVFITEFGLNPGSATAEQAATFLKDAMAYLDASDKVAGYSWFMVGSGENQLNTANGLSPLGEIYASS